MQSCMKTCFQSEFCSLLLMNCITCDLLCIVYNYSPYGFYSFSKYDAQQKIYEGFSTSKDVDIWTSTFYSTIKIDKNSV